MDTLPPLLPTFGKKIRIELILTLETLTNICTLPPPRIELFKKSPLYPLPLTWNNLGTRKLQNNRTTLKIGLKEQFIDEIV
jgi:hypothetical protein